jgi:hypothetical protein
MKKWRVTFDTADINVLTAVDEHKSKFTRYKITRLDSPQAPTLPQPNQTMIIKKPFQWPWSRS